MESSVVKVPVLIIHGIDDRFVTSDLATNTIVPRFGRAKVTSISNASHWPHLEQPVATAKAIDGFLAYSKSKAGRSFEGDRTQYIRCAGRPDSNCAATILRKLKGTNFQC